MSGNYESNFEDIEDRSIVIGDLIEQILLVEEVIVRHKSAGSSGLELQQYVDRRAEFQDKLNEQLSSYQFMLVRKEAA
jgi:predicted nucleic-acid-binding protein